ncbi:MAG TPA: PKD domain-containing protein, partial [Bacteroidia bacterium]|nr:PKD domain-containing protein [Bacteroidia bacterium]
MKLLSTSKKLISSLFIIFICALFSNSYAQVTVQYTYTGSVQSFTVPTCVTSIIVKAWGAGGSGGGTDNFPGAVGGAGAFVQSTFAVTAGQTFTIVVGGGAGPGQGCLSCAPGGTSGWGNGVIDGGTGGNAGCSGCSGGGGGGGGGTGLYNGATPWLVVGGGGGGSGGGQFSSGAVGGAGGVNGGTVAGSCASPGIAGASATGIGGIGLNKGGGDGGGGGGGGGGNNGGTGGGVAGGCDCGACGGGGGNGFASGTGTVITNGAGQVPGNSGDPPLPAGDAVGGGTSTQGGNGFLIITYTITTPVITLPPTTTICSGSPTTLTATGATTYSWSTGALTNSITVSPTTNTTYTVTGTTSTGCSATATTTVVVNPLPTIAVNSPTICTGTSATLTANGATTYSWNTGSTANSITISPTTTTTYTVTGTDVSGCMNSAISTVTVNPLPTVTVNSPTICNGTSATLTGSGATTYSWNTGSTSNPIIVTPTTTTNYTVTGTDVNGCINSAVSTVTVNPLPTVTVNSATICAGTSATLTATGATTYSWNTGSTSNPITVTPTTTTNYTVTGTDVNGCTSSTTTSVVVAPALSVTITPSAPTICLGSSTTLTANGATTYSWSNGALTNSITVSPTTTSSYTVTGTTAGCTGTASATVAVDLLNASAAGFPASCAGACNGYTEVIPTAGTLPYTYSWTPSGNITANANNLCAGNYCIKVSDANGCSFDTCVTVSEPPAMNVSIASSTNDSCYGECDGTATSLVTGGTTPYTYSWNTVPTQTTVQATGLCAGTYKITVTDANGCSNSASVTITQPSQLTVAPSAATTICIGQSTTLNATANGGTSAYTYSWNNIYNGQNYTVSPVTSPTTYTVVATDANGCLSAPETVVISINPPLGVVAKNDTSLCIGGHASLSAQGSGGDGAYNYVWQPGAIVGSLINVTPATTTIYTVTVTDNCGTPADSAKLTVTVNPLPVVSFSADSTSGCYPLCVTFINSSTPASASATWEFGDGNTSNSVATANNCYQNSGLYTVQLSVKDSLGCTNNTSVFDMINVFPHPTANFGTAPNPITIIEPTVYFQDLSTGSVNQWQWNLGDVINSYTNVQNPQYTYQDTGYYNVQLIVTDNNGCKDSITKTIYVEGQYVIYVPNAFTPNGDGINDVFNVKGTGIDPNNFDMSIYDRWGILIFHTTNLNQGWDGRVKNNLVQLGVYVWKIETKDFKGDNHQYIGHVSVIR